MLVKGIQEVFQVPRDNAREIHHSLRRDPIHKDLLSVEQVEVNSCNHCHCKNTPLPLEYIVTIWLLLQHCHNIILAKHPKDHLRRPKEHKDIQAVVEWCQAMVG